MSDYRKCCVCGDEHQTMIFVAAAAPVGAGKWYCQTHGPVIQSTPPDALRTAVEKVARVLERDNFDLRNHGFADLTMCYDELKAALAAAPAPDAVGTCVGCEYESVFVGQPCKTCIRYPAEMPTDKYRLHSK